MRLIYVLSVSALPVAAMYGVTPAAAQPASSAIPSGGPAADDTVKEAAKEIIVTGSRIARKDYVAQSPVVTTSKEALEVGGAATIDDALRELPQFQPGAGGFTNSSAGGVGLGLATLNLRGLGSQRTLVLLDGRRLEPSTATSIIDINSIPSSAISGVEVISGGASATYGSDAIAGVVNFKVYHGFEGLRIDVQDGISSRGDAGNRQASFITGKTFADGRLSVMLAGEYASRDALPYTARNWSSPSGSYSSVLPNGYLAPAGNNLPSQAALNSVFSKYGIAAGSVAPTALLGFNSDGSLFRNSNSPLNYKPNSVRCMVSQPGTLAYDGLCENNHQIPLERYAALTRAEFTVSPALKFFVQGQYSHVQATATASAPTLAATGASGLTVPASNPFIPADLQTVLAGRPNPTASFTLTKRFTDGGPRSYRDVTQTYQIVAGASGTFPIGDLAYEVYGTHGRTSLTDNVYGGSISLSAVNRLLNAPDGGASLCSGGLNLFGTIPISAACLAYIQRNTVTATHVGQDELAANLTGTVFHLPAGNVKIAVNGNYRHNSYDSKPDPLIAAGDIASTNASQPLSGAVTVVEGAAEILVPILKNIKFVNSLNLSAAYRYSHYNTSGGVSSYKVGLDWRVTAPLLMRGGYQRAVRAPSIGELFQPISGSISNIGNPPSAGDPCDIRTTFRTGANATAVKALCAATGVPSALGNNFTQQNGGILTTSQGNLGLRPEVATTFTAGMVFQPAFLGSAFRRMNLSVDYYNIRIAGAISSVSANTSLLKCFNADGSNAGYSASNAYCQNIIRDPTSGQIVNALQILQNLGGYKTSGIDIALDWAIPLDNIGLKAGDQMKLNFAASHLNNFDVQLTPGTAYLNYKGTIQSPTGPDSTAYPTWKMTTTIEFSGGPVILGGRWNHLTSFKDASVAANPASTVPGTPSYSTFDLYAKVRVNEAFELRGGLQNALDRDPPAVGGFSGVSNDGVYDAVGRYFYLGAKASF